MKFRLYFILLLLISFTTKAQQNLSLSIDQADSLFLKNNLLLLAQQYGIEGQNALIIQAKAYPNPVVNVDINAVDPQNNETFHVGSTGEKALGIQQLILMGGKRKTTIEIARQNKKLSELEFYYLLRNLRLQVHLSFYNLHRQEIVLTQYARQLQLLDTLITAYDAQAKLGNIALKDVIRLKSVYLKINNERSDLLSSRTAELQNLQMLMQSKAGFLPIVNTPEFDRFNLVLDANQILDLALENRPDLKIAHESSNLSTLNLRLQRQLSIPDVSFNTSYDQRGGAFINQINAGIALPLPLWDRNRGNIRAAQFFEKTSELNEQQKRFEVETDVLAALDVYTASTAQYNKMKNYYNEDFDRVFQGVNDNFKRRNISILEFVDFFESYNESLNEYERIKTQLASSAIRINYVTASKVF
jgi:cobalt-zinc-cadmium efflux system outer membrane protein